VLEYFLKFGRLLNEYFLKEDDCIISLLILDYSKRDIMKPMDVYKIVLDHFPNSMDALSFMIENENGYFERKKYFNTIMDLKQEKYIEIYFKDSLENNDFPNCKKLIKNHSSLELFSDMINLNDGNSMEMLNVLYTLSQNKLFNHESFSLIQMECIIILFKSQHFNPKFTEYFSNELKMIKRSSFSFKNFDKNVNFMNLDSLLDERNPDSYLNNFEKIWNLNEENEFIRSILMRIHLYKLMNPIQSNQTMKLSFLNKKSLEEFIHWIIESSISPTVEENYEDNEKEKINFINHLQNALSQSNMIWKCLAFIFMKDSTLNWKISRLFDCYSNRDNTENLFNIEFLFDEWSIQSNEIKMRLSKIQKKTKFKFLNLLSTFITKFIQELKGNKKDAFVKYFYFQIISNQNKVSKEWNKWIGRMRMKKNSEILISNEMLNCSPTLEYLDFKFYFYCSLACQKLYIEDSNIENLQKSSIFIILFLECLVSQFGMNSFESNKSEDSFLKYFELFFSKNIPSTKFPFIYENEQENGKSILFHMVRSVIPLLMDLLDQIFETSNQSKIDKFISIFNFLIDHQFMTLKDDVLCNLEYIRILVKLISHSRKYELLKNQLIDHHILFEVSLQFKSQSMIQDFLSCIDLMEKKESLLFFFNVFHGISVISEYMFCNHFLNIINVQHNYKEIQINKNQGLVFFNDEKVVFELISFEEYQGNAAGNNIFKVLSALNQLKSFNILDDYIILNQLCFKKKQSKTLTEIINYSKSQKSLSGKTDVSIWFHNEVSESIHLP
jgi:hypothetical protein